MCLLRRVSESTYVHAARGSGANRGPGAGARRRHRRCEVRRPGGAGQVQGHARDRHRRSRRPLVQLPGEQGSPAREEELQCRRIGVHLEVRPRLHPEPDPRCAERERARDRRRLPDGRLGRTGREALPEDEVRDRRQLGRRGRAQGQADQRPRSALQGAGGRLPGRVPGREAGRREAVRGPDEARRRRRPQDPAGRPLHRGLLRGREAGQREGDGHALLLAGLRRPGEVQGAGAEPDRQRRRRRLPGRRPVRSRRPLGGEGARCLRHRRRRRPGLPRPARDDERHEEGRRRGLQDDRGGKGCWCEVQDQHQRDLHGRERRRRVREDLGPRLAGA